MTNEVINYTKMKNVGYHSYDPLIARIHDFCEKAEHGVGSRASLRDSIDYLYEELHEYTKGFRLEDMEETIDGAGDVAFLAINLIYKTFRHYGLDSEDAEVYTYETLCRITEANMNKAQPDGKFRKVGRKVIKPEGWQPPRYDDMVGAIVNGENE